MVVKGMVLLAELELWMRDISNNIYSGKYVNRVKLQKQYRAIEKAKERIKNIREKRGLTNNYIISYPPKGIPR